jgi:hypothetical protein
VLVAPPARRSPLLKPPIAIGVVVALVAVAGYVLVGRRPSGPSHPDAWDARVAELVAFVETERGLTFKHPVAIDFVTESELASQASGDGDEVTPKVRAAADTQARVMRALGLARGPIDLLDESDSLVSQGVVAFYSPATERIVAPAGTLSAYQRATLVHELTHALQDQYFDIGRTMKDSGAESAWRALIEGDAVRVANAYTAQLGDADRNASSDEANDGYEEYQRDTATVSSALDAMFQAPYVLGPSMTEVMVDLDGPKGLNSAFRSPPVSDEAFLDPVQYRGNGKVLGVDEPRTVAGENVVDRGEIGALTWYLMLSESTDLPTALNAAYGWGGDAYVAVDSGRDLCVRIAYRGDSPGDNDEMVAALNRWAASAPEARREVSVRGALVNVVACDPGPDSPTPLAGNAPEALLGPRAVTDIARRAHEAGTTFTRARCIGMAFVSGLSTEQLNALWTADSTDQAATADLQNRLLAAGSTCAGVA